MSDVSVDQGFNCQSQVFMVMVGYKSNRSEKHYLKFDNPLYAQIRSTNIISLIMSLYKMYNSGTIDLTFPISLSIFYSLLPP